MSPCIPCCLLCVTSLPRARTEKAPPGQFLSAASPRLDGLFCKRCDRVLPAVILVTHGRRGYNELNAQQSHSHQEQSDSCGHRAHGRPTTRAQGWCGCQHVPWTGQSCQAPAHWPLMAGAPRSSSRAGAPDWQVAATARWGRCFPRRHWRPWQGAVYRAKREHVNLLGGASKWAVSTALKA